MSNQSTINLPPMITTGNVWLAAQAILAIDFGNYTASDKERAITVYLVGPHELELEMEDADSFKVWWDSVTGQARIQTAPSGLKLS